jgi:ATP-binding cassette, subfamily C, bacterial
MSSDTPAVLFREARTKFLWGFAYAWFVGGFLNFAMLISPIFMIQVYTRVIPSRSYDTLYGLILIGVFGIVIYGLLEFVRSYTYSVMAHGFFKRFNLPAMQASILKSISGHGNDGAQVIRDIGEVKNFINGNNISSLIDAFWALIFLASLLLIHPTYAIVATFFIALMVVLNIVSDYVTKYPVKEANLAQQRHLQEIAGSLRFAEVIEAMGMLPALVRKWRQSQSDMLAFSAEADVKIRIVLAITKSLHKSLQMVTVATGALLVLNNEISTGVLFAGMVLTSQAVGPYSNMVENWQQWMNARLAWTRIKTLIEQEGSARQTMPAPVGDGDLVVENLVYIPEGRDVPVLHGVSFSVSPGEVLGIAGPSGAGKSTLARCLTGIIKPTVGGVYLDGHSTWLWERGSFGKAVGYLPQSLSLLDGTIRQTISRMQDSDPRDVIRAAQQAGVHDMIGRLPHGYDTPVQEGMHMLSGGQSQRLALARALYGEPKLLILDEPNSNLDHVGEQALIAAIESVKARGGIVVMIAHRPSVMAIADKLMVIEDGSVSQFGPRTEVIEMIMPGVRAVTRRPSV